MTNIQELYSNYDKGWVIGFTDGEGCFNLDVHVKKDMRWGLQMQPEFTIVQHERDKALHFISPKGNRRGTKGLSFSLGVERLGSTGRIKLAHVITIVLKV